MGGGWGPSGRVPGLSAIGRHVGHRDCTGSFLSPVIQVQHTRVVLRVALAAIVLGVFSHTRADPDLWGHVRFGADIVAARSVHVADRYSFTSDRPWVNHEWLAEVTMAGAYGVGGGPGLIALKVILLVAMLTAVVWVCRRSQLADMPHDLLVGLVVFATVPQANHVRPQLFSLVLFAWLLAMLTVARGRPAYAWMSVPLMAVWANLHGGWLVGLAALTLWAAGSVIDAASARERLRLAAIVLAAAAATLVNPYGWRLWMFLYDTVGLGRADISEWQPMTRAGYPVAIMWGIVAGAAVTGVVRSIADRRFDARAIAVVALLAMMSFRVNRLLAFFGIATVILVGPHVVAAFARIPRSTRAARQPAWPATAAALAVGLLLATGGVAASVRNAGCVRMDLPIFPDASAAAAIAGRAVHGRMLTWFDWGEYALWHFSPAVAVSIDGRRETVYSDALIHQHLAFYFAPAERQAVLAALQPDYIWLPRELEITDRLVRDGWTPIVEGERSVLLSKEAAARGVIRREMPGARCFPGP